MNNKVYFDKLTHIMYNDKIKMFDLIRLSVLYQNCNPVFYLAVIRQEQNRIRQQ